MDVTVHKWGHKRKYPSYRFENFKEPSMESLKIIVEPGLVEEPTVYINFSTSMGGAFHVYMTADELTRFFAAAVDALDKSKDDD